MMEKKKIYVILAVALIVILAAFVVTGIVVGGKREAVEVESKAVLTIPEPDRTKQKKIVLKQDASAVSGDGVKVNGNILTIHKAGTYLVSGTLTEGQLVVDAGNNDTVILMLQNVKLSNSLNAAIYVKNAGHTSVRMEDGTENKLQSGEKVEVMETEADQAATGAALYAKSDLSITGTGSLMVCGFQNNGIQTKDNLVIEQGKITVEAVGNGMKGKDSVTISGGEISITSGKDGIKSDNTEGKQYGNIIISGGSFKIESREDAVQAEYALQISDGKFDVTAGEGSEQVTYPSDSGMRHSGMGGRFGGNGEQRERPDGQEGSDASFEKERMDFGGERIGQGMPDGEGGQETSSDEEETNWDMSDEEETSRKGFKAGQELYISGGIFSVNSYDDAFHSNGSIEISDGELTIASGDDGVHADTELSIKGCKIDVTKAYEGLEGNQITIDAADITIVAMDDGINAYGGQRSMGGGSSKTTEEMPELCIMGGKLSVNAEGDGLDSNGNLSIEGGTILVDGPTNGGNGALDSGSENGGVCTISGGTILALGSSGMAEGFSGESKQCSFQCNLDAAFEKGSEIVIVDSNGMELFGYTAVKSGDSVVFSCPEMKQGETYKLRVDGEEQEISMDSVAVNSGNHRGGWR